MDKSALKRTSFTLNLDKFTPGCTNLSRGMQWLCGITLASQSGDLGSNPRAGVFFSWKEFSISLLHVGIGSSCPSRGGKKNESFFVQYCLHPWKPSPQFSSHPERDCRTGECRQ